MPGILPARGPGPGASKVTLRADFGIRSMAVKVFKERILLVLHISSLDDTAWAKMICREHTCYIFWSQEIYSSLYTE